MWPFGKKNSADDAATDAETAVPQATVSAGAAQAQPVAQLADSEQTTSLVETPAQAEVSAVTASGPFDGAEHSPEDYDFSDFSNATLDLGSLLLPLPKQSQVQVEMGPRGPKMLHILTEQGRITPVAFAAPASGGQWEKAIEDIRTSMENDGITVAIEQGPWGPEIVGRANEKGNVIRIIGVDGPRWMLRVTLATHNDKAEAIAQVGRDVIARSFVQRGDAAILAGDSLPVRLPKPLADQVVAEMKRRNELNKKVEEADREAGREA
ncbi:MAG: DUF3710 domain-containing protein [Corynebacterium sp.]|nr:DUF3710 domain-containing protein [Corynebacterium sp.]